jgi:hypothetical protein
MTVFEKLERAQAVLALGSDDETRCVFLDPAWLPAGEGGAHAFDQISQHRNSYAAGGLILTATDLRELADTLEHDTPETVKSALLDTAANYDGLLCEDCYQELASECTICPQLRMESAREVAE